MLFHTRNPTTNSMKKSINRQQPVRGNRLKKNHKHAARSELLQKCIYGCSMQSLCSLYCKSLQYKVQYFYVALEQQSWCQSNASIRIWLWQCRGRILKAAGSIGKLVQAALVVQDPPFSLFSYTVSHWWDESRDRRKKTPLAMNPGQLSIHGRLCHLLKNVGATAAGAAAGGLVRCYAAASAAHPTAAPAAVILSNVVNQIVEHNEIYSETFFQRFEIIQ